MYKLESCCAIQLIKWVNVNKVKVQYKMCWFDCTQCVRVCVNAYKQFVFNQIINITCMHFLLLKLPYHMYISTCR